MDERILEELSERIVNNKLGVGLDQSLTEPMVFVPMRLLVKIQAVLERVAIQDGLRSDEDQVGGTD